MLRDEEWTVKEGLVMKKEQIYIPERELREEVICLHHDIYKGCKNLDCDALELLLVQGDKKNSIKSLFNCCTLLIHILLFTSIYKVPHISFESFLLICLLIS